MSEDVKKAPEGAVIRKVKSINNIIDLISALISIAIILISSADNSRVTISLMATNFLLMLSLKGYIYERFLDFVNESNLTN